MLESYLKAAGVQIKQIFVDVSNENKYTVCGKQAIW